jgi:hypothetical protein
MRALSLSTEGQRNQPSTPLELEIAMTRIALICAFAALLGSALLGSHGTASANQYDWAQARLACADVGLDPGSGAFGQCVFDLYYSLWDEQNVAEH